MEVAVLDVHARGQQGRLSERAQRAHQVGIVEDLRRARHAQRLAVAGTNAIRPILRSPGCC